MTRAEKFMVLEEKWMAELRKPGLSQRRFLARALAALSLNQRRVKG